MMSEPRNLKPESWFCTAERLMLLEFQAGKWIGTPFFPNSRSPGPRGGVSCQKLVEEIYRACGFVDVRTPDVKMGHSQFSSRSLVEEFMGGLGDFARLERAMPEELMAGDLIAMRIGRVSHHLGIVMPPEGPGGRARGFIHAMRGLGVVVSSFMDGTWSARLEAAWRPRRKPKAEGAKFEI